LREISYTKVIRDRSSRDRAPQQYTLLGAPIRR
jgi:hypothetical protein